MKICATGKLAEVDNVNIVCNRYNDTRKVVAERPNYRGSRARLAAVRMAQLQLIRSAHTFRARCMHVQRPH